MSTMVYPASPNINTQEPVAPACVYFDRRPILLSCSQLGTGSASILFTFSQSVPSPNIPSSWSRLRDLSSNPRWHCEYNSCVK